MPIVPSHSPADDGRDKVVSQRQAVMRTILTIAFVAVGLYILHGFIAAIIWAVILAIAVWPLYRRALDRFPPGRHNLLMPSLFTLAITLIFVVPLLVFGIELAREGREVLAWYRHVQASGLAPPDWIAKLSFGSWNAKDWWQTNLSNPPELSAIVHRLNGASVLGFTHEVTRRIVVFGFTLVTLFFVFRHGGTLGRDMIRASQRVFGPSGERLGRQMITSVHGTVDGLVLVGLGEGVLIGISYAIARAPHPAMLAAATAIAAMIPFGAPVVFIIAALIVLAQGSIVAAIGIVVFGFVVTGVADHAVRPVLIGGATKLPFLWVLFGILGGVETFGLIGLFIGPAVMAALILLWRELLEPGAAIGEPGAEAPTS